MVSITLTVFLHCWLPPPTEDNYFVLFLRRSGLFARCWSSSVTCTEKIDLLVDAVFIVGFALLSTWPLSIGSLTSSPLVTLRHNTFANDLYVFLFFTSKMLSTYLSITAKLLDEFRSFDVSNRSFKHSIIQTPYHLITWSLDHVEDDCCHAIRSWTLVISFKLHKIVWLRITERYLTLTYFSVGSKFLFVLLCGRLTHKSVGRLYSRRVFCLTVRLLSFSWWNDDLLKILWGSRRGWLNWWSNFWRYSSLV